MFLKTATDPQNLLRFIQRSFGLSGLISGVVNPVKAGYEMISVYFLHII